MPKAKPQQHRILRQVIEINGCTVGNEQHVRSLMRSTYYKSLLTSIDRICSKLSAPDRIHRINRLEIDLGKLPVNALGSDLGKSFEKVFQEKLASAIHHVPKIDADLELFNFFIHTSNLPWWADKNKPELLSETLEALIHKKSDTLRQLLQNASNPEQIWRRISRAYPDALLDRLANLLAPDSWSGNASANPAVGTSWLVLLQEASTARGRSKIVTRNLFWEHVLRAAGSHGQAPTSVFYKGILQQIANNIDYSYPTLINTLQQSLETRNATPSVNIWVRKTIHQLAQDLDADNDTKTDHDASAESNTDTDPKIDHDASAESNTDTDLKTDPVQSDFSKANALYIGNAGLAILWPFLTHFFQRLGLIEEDAESKQQFTDEAARQRAVGLLQYLASADESPQETLLPLNKILCGMAVTAVFDFGPEINAKEKEECNHLLTAVIQRAPILKDMSHAGFRSSFLLRQGQLSVCDERWLLRVERETFDVVLDRFPWGFGIVKLPWMATMMQVEW